MTPEELLGLVERLRVTTTRWLTSRCDCENCAAIREARRAITDDAMAELRSITRTPEETAALKAAFEWLTSFLNEDESFGIVSAEEFLVKALDAIPQDRRQALLRGESC